MVVHLGVGEVTLLLAAGDQQLQLRLAILGHALGAGRKRLAVLLRDQLGGGPGIEGGGRGGLRLAAGALPFLGAAAAAGLCALSAAGAAPGALRGLSAAGACAAAAFLATTVFTGFFSGVGCFLLVAVGFGFRVMVKLVQPRINYGV